MKESQEQFPSTEKFKHGVPEEYQTNITQKQAEAEKEGAEEDLPFSFIEL